MIPVAVMLSGRGSNMQALVDHARGYRVVLVLSDNPDAPGLAWAAARGIQTFALSPRGIGKAAMESSFLDHIAKSGAQVIALAGYMRLLTPGFIATVRGTILNIHPSLLPLYKGLDTHARALAAGDTEAGCSVHRVTDELDAGEVLGKARVPILANDTPDTLAARVLAAEHRLYPRVLMELCMIDRLRDIALRLPETGEEGGAFLVGGQPFARFSGAAVELRGAEGWQRVELGDDTDWQQVEDQIAGAWELTAPAGLLEAGGR